MSTPIENRYWNSNGEAQNLYDEMQNAGWAYTKASESAFHAYYRYYNDGDLPGWARSRWDITRYSYDYGYGHRVLTEAGEEEFERRITERMPSAAFILSTARFSGILTSTPSTPLSANARISGA